MRSYMVNICPECGAQQADGTDTHFHGLEGRCPNADRVWAPRAVEVVPARWAGVAHDLAEATLYYKRMDAELRDLLAAADAPLSAALGILSDERTKAADALAAYRALAGEEGV